MPILLLLLLFLCSCATTPAPTPASKPLLQYEKMDVSMAKSGTGEEYHNYSGDITIYVNEAKNVLWIQLDLR